MLFLKIMYNKILFTNFEKEITMPIGYVECLPIYLTIISLGIDQLKFSIKKVLIL